MSIAFAPFFAIGFVVFLTPFLWVLSKSSGLRIICRVTFAVSLMLTAVLWYAAMVCQDPEASVVELPKQLYKSTVLAINRSRITGQEELKISRPVPPYVERPRTAPLTATPVQ